VERNVPELSPSMQGCRDARQQGGALVALHGGHVGISSSTWWATVGARWEPILGRLRADLDLGPKSKVETHLMIYKTH